MAKANYDLALNSIRQKTWENDIALAEAQVHQAKATLDLNQAQLANLIILSPMNGGVTKRFVDPGTMVKDTTPILTLMDLTEMKMVVNVIEREFVHLQKGQPVKITVTAFPDRIFTGRIDIINPGAGTSVPHGGDPDLHSQPGVLVETRDVRAGGDSSSAPTPRRLWSPSRRVLSEVDKDFVFVLQGGQGHSPAECGRAS